MVLYDKEGEVGSLPLKPEEVGLAEEVERDAGDDVRESDDLAVAITSASTEGCFCTPAVDRVSALVAQGVPKGCRGVLDLS